MRASEFITEVFQPGKTNWKWRRQSSDEAFASFVVGDREYQWHAVHWCPDPTKWEIQFRLMREKTDPDGLDLFGRTGTGNSAQVLSTAVDITREFIKQYGIDKVKEIKFNAKEDSRIGLYAKMIQRLLPDWDLYQKYTKYNGMEYRLTDPRAYDKPENKITEGQGVAEGKLNEIRDQLWTWVQSKFPRTQWPEYVQRDFLYQQAKGIRNQAELDDFLKRNRNDFGKVQWRLEKLPITMDIFTPKTQRMILSREGGSSNPFQVPRDAERHAHQLKMIQQKGVSEEPIIVAKLSNGYDLIEGWHRTIQHLKEFPQGYTAPAWVGYGATYTSESVEQAVAEGVSNSMSTDDMIAYLRQHHDTNLHQDYLNHVNTFSKFVLKDIPTNTLKTDLPGLDREKVERYKKMDQSKAPPIVLGGKYILDGYHRANAVKELGIPTIKAYVGVQGVTEGNFDSFKFGKPITFTAYHSSDSKIKRILPTDEFYFSDDRYTWEGNYLYKIKITLKNPYVVLDQKAGYEGHASDSLPKIKAAGYDGVIYTPYSVDYGFRQGVCFYPQQQISNIKLVNSDSGE